MDSYNKQKKSISPIYFVAASLVAGFLFAKFTTPSVPSGQAFVHTASASVSGTSDVKGTVTFSQAALGGVVTVKGHIEGIEPNSKRGFHIHALGDLSGGCASAGPHYNPFNVAHGARSDTVRHVGDLGNIEADAKGVADFEFEDTVIGLNGPLSIIGRTLMVHAGKDDLGRGEDDESKKTGNAGGRAACGVIGVADLA